MKDGMLALEGYVVVPEQIANFQINLESPCENQMR